MTETRVLKKLGRPRKTEDEKKQTIQIRLTGATVKELEKEGKLTDVITRIVLEHLRKKID